MKNEIASLKNKKNKPNQNELLISEFKKLNTEIRNLVTLKYNNSEKHINEIAKMKSEITNLKNQAKNKPNQNNLLISEFKNLNNKVSALSKIKENNLKKEFSKIEKQINSLKNRNTNRTNYVSTSNSAATYIANKTENVNKKIISYADSRLNNSININDINNVPIYNGCDTGITTEASRKNCFISNISIFTSTNLNKKILPNHITGFNFIRVLMVVDRNGNSEAVRIIGNWDNDVKNEVKRVVNLIPNMKPGKLNNINEDVKYSFQLPIIL